MNSCSRISGFLLVTLLCTVTPQSAEVPYAAPSIPLPTLQPPAVMSPGSTQALMQAFAHGFAMATQIYAPTSASMPPNAFAPVAIPQPQVGVPAAMPQPPLAFPTDPVMPPTLVAPAPAPAPAPTPAAPKPNKNKFKFIDGSLCTVLDFPGIPNFIAPNHFARCKDGAKFNGGNQMEGDLYLEKNAVWSGNSRIVGAKTYVSVGEKSIVGKSSTFITVAIIGKRCNLGDGGIYESVEISDDVDIGSGANLKGAIREVVQVGKNLRTSFASVIEKYAKLGDNIILGEYSNITEYRDVGSNSCIGSNVLLKVDLPPWSIYNSVGGIQKRNKNKKVAIINGFCVEF